MLMLHELQDRFAASVVDADPVRTAGAIVDDPPGAAARLGIYINHFQVTLTDVLETTFPVVRQLVGDPFFRMVARHYVRDAPPRHPCLFEYGGGFPGFLERLPEVRSLPYLADVARLEWAINEAWHAADAPAIAAVTAAEPMAGCADVSLRLHPSCRLIASVFPVNWIWQIHQKACSERETVDLDAGGVRLLVHRQEDEVGWIELSAADFAFVDSVLDAGSLSNSLMRARAVDGDFNPRPLLAALIDGGLISSLTSVP